MHRFIPAMTSLAGSSVAEIKVKHHARKFGISKYGLSRIYKVLLDLLTIKTIVSFASRPMLWFSFMAIPFLLLSVITLFIFAFSFFSEGTGMLVIFASLTIIFTASGFFLVIGGALGELIYKTGDTKIDELAFLTIKNITNK